MVEQTQSQGPQWLCNECGAYFSAARTTREIPQIDDVTDAFSKHSEGARNLCPTCGGLLRLVKR